MSGAFTNGPDAPSGGKEFDVVSGTFASKLGPRKALTATSRASISMNKMKNVRRRWRFGGNVCIRGITGIGCELSWVGNGGEAVKGAAFETGWYCESGIGRDGVTHIGPFCSGKGGCCGGSDLVCIG